MNFFNFPIKRPITILMGMLVTLILGAIALWKMPVDLMPKINFPNLMMIVQYEGAGPEEMEERVVKPMEQVLKTVADIKNVFSSSQEGVAVFNLEFNYGVNLDTASADVREKLSIVRKYLPDEMEEPIMLKINLTEMPVMFLNLYDPNRDLLELRKIAEDSVTPRLESLPGVASAQAMGGRKREIHVNLDKDRMKSYSLDFMDVVNTIRYQNVDKTAGYFTQSGQRFRITARGEFNDLEEMGNMVVGNGMTSSQRQQQALTAILPYKDPMAGTGSISPIRLRDVAQIEDGTKEVLGKVRVMDDKGHYYEEVGIAVMKETDSNMVTVAGNISKALPEIIKSLPKGCELQVMFNFADIIMDSINALKRGAIEGAIGAIIILFLFLWQIRPTIIVALSIPLSILMAFICMFFMGYTLNIMTMGGLVIALGKLVDDSIVVLENTYRHLNMGKHPHQAAEDGFRQVVVAVTSATLVAVIIFLPVFFVSGFSAQLFRTFAGTFFFAVMSSLAVSYTVVPMLCSRFFKQIDAIPEKKRRREIFKYLQNFYVRTLAYTLEHKMQVFIMLILILALTIMIAIEMPTEFMPKFVSTMYDSRVSLPPGSSLDQTEKVTEQIRQGLSKYKDIKKIFIQDGQESEVMSVAYEGESRSTNDARLLLLMRKKVEGRTTTKEQLKKVYENVQARNPSITVDFQEPTGPMMGGGKPVSIKIFGKDFTVLKQLSDRVYDAIKDVEGIADLTTSMKKGVPQLDINFDRDRLISYGVVAGQAAMNMSTAMEGTVASLYRESGDEYDIRVRLSESQRQTFTDLTDVPVVSPMGFSLPLRDVAKFEYTEGPRAITRENSKRKVTVEANKTNRPLSQVINDVEKRLKTVPFPEGYQYEFGGERKSQMDAFSDLIIMLVLSIFLVYIVLASLYESLIHPFTILLPVPYALTGAIVGLFIAKIGFGVTAFIGVIMLIGIVAFNSIVLIDFMLEFYRGGMPRRQAILEAGRTRLRPILMTATATMFGVLPIALGRAEGMELQQPMGIVVFGGLFSSTLLTLYIIPWFFEIFDDVMLDVTRLFRGGKPEAQKPQEI